MSSPVADALLSAHGGAMLAAARYVGMDDTEAADIMAAVLRASADASDGDELQRAVIAASVERLKTHPHPSERSIHDLLPAFLIDGQHVGHFRHWPAGNASAAGDAGLTRAAINELPETFRLTVVLTDVLGCSVDEVATLMATTPNAVRIRLQRGRLALRTLLSQRLEPS